MSEYEREARASPCGRLPTAPYLETVGSLVVFVCFSREGHADATAEGLGQQMDAAKRPELSFKLFAGPHHLVLV